MDFMAHHELSARIFSRGLHAHDFYELYFHLGGARYYCIDDTIYELQPNQFILIPPLHMHGLVCDRDLVDYERCYLYLSTELLQKCGFGKIDLIRLFEKTYQDKKIVRNLSLADIALCKELLQSIEKLGSADSVYSTQQYLSIYTKILNLLQIIEHTLETEDIPVPLTNATHTSSMQEVLHYVNDHYTENITVESLHQLFHISSSLLSHKFKEYTGKGVYEYILYRRILRAKELMYSELSLTEIAYQCGFNDYSNFLRVFKRLSGSSPREFRLEK